MVGALDLKSGDPEFKSRSDHQLDLSHIVPGSTPRLRLYKANWSASCQLGFLTSSVHLLYSVDICMVGLQQPMAANYQPTYQIKIIIIIIIIIVIIIIIASLFQFSTVLTLDNAGLLLGFLGVF